MADQSSIAPIIVVKKKGGHGGHHGGAWKVAYADFVTAMMALFIVLWLLNSSQEVQKAVGGYFQDPEGHGKQVGSAQSGSGEALMLPKDDMGKLKESIEQAMKAMPEFPRMKNQVQLTVTGEGLRVELLETDRGMFFERGNAQPSEAGKEILIMLSQQLSKLANNVLMEGHTDSRPFAGGGPYTNWELSSDRANSARRLMQSSGLRSDQVAQVRGFSDQHLLNKAEPDHASNRRISVIVQYLDGPQKTAEPATEKKAEGDAKPKSAGH